MADLLQETYLPEFEKKQIRDSNVYKLLKENNEDTSVLEGYENNPKYTPIEIKDFDTFINEGGTKEDWIAKHATPERKKEFFGAIGDFLVDTGKDTVLSLGVAAINGADVAANLMPIMAKVLDNAPSLAGAKVMNAQTEGEVYNAAKYVSDNLGSAREYLKSFKEDDNVVSQLIGIMGQDLVYSVPIYNKLRDLGMPKYPAFFISGGIGGAIGIEDKILGEESTFSLHYGAKEIEGLKNLIGILPNTPEDQIADEVVQALEYGAFSVAIPGIIDAFKFMKRYIPAFAGGAALTTIPGDDAEANPIKAITNAIFKSSVRDAAEKKITSGSGQQILNTIQNTPGVKSSEIKWIGLDTFLKDKKKVSQEEVLKFIEDNRIDVTEVMFPRKGTDFGMYQKMIESVELRKIDFINSKKDLKGGDQRIDFDNYYVSTLGPNKKEFERISFTGLDTNPIGKTIRSFDDVNTFEVDVDAIKKQYKSDDLENSVDFYIVEDIEVGKDLAISKADYNDPKFNPIIKNDLGKEVGNKYELEFVTNMSFDELDKYALEHTSRSIKALRAKQEGTTRYQTYTEPGGEDYKELVFKFKQRSGDLSFVGGKSIPVESRVTKAASIDEYEINESPHFGEPGEIAHVRFKTRMNGNMKVLSVEEMQSDLVQAVKRSNKDVMDDAAEYGGEIEDMEAMDNVITDFPFKNNWYELTLKRLIRYAADNGFDAISIPKGSVIQDRYGLTKRIDDFQIGSFDPVRKEVTLEAQDQKGMLQISELYTFDRVEKEFGKDVLDRIIKKGKSMKQADYDDYNNIVALPKTIEIGGEGKYQLYNKTIPAFLKKYGKKWNAKVYDDVIEDFESDPIVVNEGDVAKFPVTIIKITPEMKKSVQGTPQPLFEIFGGVSLSTWIADEVSDTMQNNNISQTTN